MFNWRIFLFVAWTVFYGTKLMQVLVMCLVLNLLVNARLRCTWTNWQRKTRDFSRGEGRGLGNAENQFEKPAGENEFKNPEKNMAHPTA